jgi:hypothetical protein
MILLFPFNFCSIWDWNDGTRELNMEDARSMATDKWNLNHVSIIFNLTLFFTFNIHFHAPFYIDY